MSAIFSGFDIRGRMGESMTTDDAWALGKAFADWVPHDGRIVVISSPTANRIIVNAVTEGLRLQGRDVIDGGQGDVQTLTQVSIGSHTVGGVLIGRDELQSLETIELYDDRTTLLTSESGLNEIAALVAAGNFVPAAAKGELTSII